MKPAAVVGLAVALGAGLAMLMGGKPASAQPGGSSSTGDEREPGGVSSSPGGAPSTGSSGARLLKLTQPNMQGADVLAWQQQLARLGLSPGKLDGVFGPMTETKTRELQLRAKIKVDGVVGPATRAAAARLLLAGGAASSPATPGPINLPGPVVSTPSGATMVPPDALLQEVATALASNDPIVIKATAVRMATLGWPQLAKDLEAALAAVEAGQAVPVPLTTLYPVQSPGLPTASKPPSNVVPLPVVKPATPAAPVKPLPRVLMLTSPNQKGADVLALQQRLTALGYAPGNADGVFGPATETAVRTFQAENRLTVDGKVGPATQAALVTAKPRGTSSPAPVVASKPAATARVLMLTKPNMQGEDVRQVQQRLNALGYSVGTADGVFGPKSDAAVRAFQKAKKLTVDGKVGPATRAAMSLPLVAGDFLGAADVIVAPLEPQAATPLPGVVPAVAPGLEQSPFQQLATLLVHHLVTHPATGSEDRTLVANFQRSVRGLQVTGFYGPGTAYALITGGTGHVPPKPRYWPKEGTAGSKATYARKLLEQAQRDPQRAEEWRQAAEV